MGGFEDQWREQPQDVDICARAGEHIVVEKTIANLDGGAIADEAQQQAHPLDGPDRANDALCADLGLPFTHVGEQVLGLDGFDDSQDRSGLA